MVESPRSFSPAMTITGLLREIRPWQWYKQGVMLLGITFSKNLLNVEAWISLLIGFVSFTAITGSTYIFNDISDLEDDRKHPEKQDRPIASGQVSVPVAAGFGIVLALFGIGAAFKIGPLFVALLFVYLGQNALYSIYLKDIIFVDVIIVAFGFVLRAIAGVIAIEVFLSPWLLVSTFLLALVLALGKRRNELENTSNPGEIRSVLNKYSKQNIDQLLVITMATLLMAYSLYSFSQTDPIMMATLPFAFYGVFRYHHLVQTTEIAGQPEYLLTDLPSIGNLILWSVIAIAVLYNVPQKAVEVVQ